VVAKAGLTVHKNIMMYRMTYLVEARYKLLLNRGGC
jgi:hypothetical protein